MRFICLAALLLTGCPLIDQNGADDSPPPNPVVEENDSYLVFDGDGDYVVVEDPADEALDFGEDAFTLSFWIKTDSLTPGQILCKRDAAGDHVYEMELWEEGRVGMNFGGTSQKVIADGRWHHVAYVRDGFIHELYIDGVLENEGSRPPEPEASVSSDGPLKFAADGMLHVDPEQPGEYLDGALDEIAMWRARLTAKSISLIHGGGRSMDLLKQSGDYTFTDELAGYWTFDEGRGDIAHDATAHGNHGTIVNATWANDDPVDPPVAAQPPVLDPEGTITPIVMPEDSVANLASMRRVYDDGFIVDPDSSFDELSFSLSMDNEAITLDWDGEVDSSPMLTPDPDYFGAGTLTLCVSDGSHEVCGTNSVTVTPVNDPPVIVALPEVNIDENGSWTAPSMQEIYNDGIISDVDTPLEGLSFSASIDSDFITIDWDQEASSNPVVTPNPGYTGTATLTLCIQDGEHEVCADLQVIVSPV